jgi:hypothetical protein
MGAGPDLAMAQGVSWTTSVLDLQSQKPLAGVNVCIAPANQVCATTTASGMVALTVPPSAQFMLSYTLANYATQFTEHTSSTIAGSNQYLMVSSSTASVLAAAVSKQMDPNKGSLVFSAIDATSLPLSGVTFAITPASGDGPYYFSSSGLPDSSAKSSSSNGLGFVLNLTASDYDVTAMLTGKTCSGSPNKSWPGSTSASVKARSIVGGITTVSLVCN